MIQNYYLNIKIWHHSALFHKICESTFRRLPIKTCITVCINVQKSEFIIFSLGREKTAMFYSFLTLYLFIETAI